MEQINFAIDEAVRQSSVISSTLPSTLTQQANLSAILIIIDMTICFIAHAANIVTFDSHLHGNFGALIASKTVENTENFLKAVKEMISPNYNM